MQTTNKLQLTGEILEYFDLVEGASWQKMDFLLRTDEQFPKEILISVWTKTLEQLYRTKKGDRVILQINIQSKPSNDKSRYFTEVTAWKIEVDFKNIVAQATSLNPGTIPHPSQVG
jgi:hypothetical protein